jgi:hypothetical protein
MIIMEITHVGTVVVYSSGTVQVYSSGTSTTWNSFHEPAAQR